MTYGWFTTREGRQIYRKIGGSEPARSHLAAPMLIGDSMPAAEHPCDGQSYESKSAFRRVTRAHGCVEVGNDVRAPVDHKPDRKAIRQAVQKASAQVKSRN